MKIKIPYGGASAEVEFPDSAVVLEPKPAPALDDNLIRSGIFSSFDNYREQFSGKRVTIVVNDSTRRLPTAKILEFLLSSIPPSSMEVLVATGTHRAPTDSELDMILGPARKAFDNRIFIHDCRDDNSLTHLGYTSRGTPVEVNRKLTDAECVIAINSVEPHFFAGFTGGRKSLIPGLAGFSTTVLNHSLAKFEDSKSLNLDTNPVNQDLEEAVRLIKEMPVFSIQLVTSLRGDIVGIFCGDMKTAFEKAVKRARDAYTVDIENKYDIVFAVGEAPLDINLYQLQKAQEHGAEAVADGGILVVVGACNEGTGSDYFMKLADDYPAPESALSSKAMSDNRFGIHKLVKTARRLKKIKIWYVTKLDDKLIRKVYYEPKKSLQVALDEALGMLGRSARVAVLRDACFILPVL